MRAKKKRQITCQIIEMPTSKRKAPIEPEIAETETVDIADTIKKSSAVPYHNKF